MSETEMANAQGETRLYELGINLVPALDEQIDAAFEEIKSFITNAGAQITAESKPALIDLAYTIGKNIDSKWYRYNTAHFGWVKFTAEGAMLAEIKEEIEAHAAMLRYMVIKTTAEAATEAQSLAETLGGDKSPETTEGADTDAPEEAEGEAETEEDAVSSEETPAAETDADKVEAAIEELVEAR